MASHVSRLSVMISDMTKSDKLRLSNCTCKSPSGSAYRLYSRSLSSAAEKLRAAAEQP